MKSTYHYRSRQSQRALTHFLERPKAVGEKILKKKVCFAAARQDVIGLSFIFEQKEDYFTKMVHNYQLLPDLFLSYCQCKVDTFEVSPELGTWHELLCSISRIVDRCLYIIWVQLVARLNRSAPSRFNSHFQMNFCFKRLTLCS